MLDTEPGATTVAGWLPTCTAGPANESAQTVSFSLLPQAAASLTFSVAPTLNTATGALSFTVAPGSFGSAAFMLEARDDGGTDRGGMNVATTPFTIVVNTPPVANPDTFVALQTAACIVIDIKANDIDVDGDALSIRLTDIPDSGKAYVYDPTQPNNHGPQLTVGIVAAGPICYQPNSRFFTGVDMMEYQALDGRGGVSPETTATITINEF